MVGPRPRRALALLALGLALAPACGRVSPRSEGVRWDAGSSAALPTRPEPARLLERVAVLGASASAGFNLERELGERRSLAQLLPVLLVGGAPTAVLDGADPLMFLDPAARGAVQIERTLVFEPTAVLALDFLFWFAYGPFPEEQRGARFERGLALLEQLALPLAVADLPDMSRAKAVVMPPGYVPAPDTLVALNRRLAGWAEGRDSVTVVPLAELVAKVHRQEPVQLRAERWPGARTGGLLQWDGLHPSVEGSLLFLALGIEALDERSGGSIGPHINWQIRASAERLVEDAE